MAGATAVIPRYQFFSSAGAPLVNGTLETYLAGTTTPVATYSDSGLSSSNGTTITLDSRGECVLWLDDTKTYKFVLKDSSGSTQWTVDNISGSINPAALGFGVATLSGYITAHTCATYADLRNYTGTSKTAYVSGYLASAAPSGIAGYFTRDDSDTTTADNGGTVLVDASGRRWKRIFDGRVNVQWFGAVADGADSGSAYTGTDNTSAFQTALNYCGLNDKPLYIPFGKYRFAALTVNDTSSLLLNYDRHVIVSDGAELLMDEDAPNSYSVIDFIRTPSLDTSTALDDRDLLSITGVTFRGRWTHSKTYSGVNVLTVQNFKRIELHNVKVYDLRAKFSRSRYIGSVNITDFTGERIASDCLRFIDSPNVTINGFTLREIDDDCIALHQSSTAIADVRQSISITNGVIEKCEGILVLGARNTTVSGVTMRLCYGTQIYVGGKVSTEGDTSPFAVNISNVNVVDPLNRADGGSNGIPPTALLTSLEAAIVVAGIEPSAATSTVRPEFYTGGAFVVPYDNDSASDPIFYNTTAASKSINGAFNVSVTGFNVIRTLPSVAAYADWGFGNAFSRYGYFNPAVADANFATHGVMLVGAMKGATVSAGNVFGFPNGAAVYLKSSAALAADRDREFENVIISNVNGRHVKYGVTHSLTAAAAEVTWDVSVMGCDFDCDPYCESSARTSPIDGSWQDAIAVGSRPVGVYFRMSQGWKIHGNTFANCYDPVLSNGNFEEKADLADNIVKCQPSAVGFSTSNKGVGLLPGGGHGMRHMIFDCDPTSATYMEFLNACVTEASSVPTTGTYVTGHFVRKRNPSTASSKTTLGWIRTSVGSTHTEATTTTADWSPLVVPTS